MTARMEVTARPATVSPSLDSVLLAGLSSVACRDSLAVELSVLATVSPPPDGLPSLDCLPPAGLSTDGE